MLFKPAGFLQAFHFWQLLFCLFSTSANLFVVNKKTSLPGNKPSRRYIVVPNQKFKPRDLEYISFRLFFQRIHIPAIYSVSGRKCLFAAYYFVRFQNL